MTWADLEAHADRPDAQRLIRGAIRAGEIRVIPGPGGIKIVPAKGASKGPPVVTV